MKIRIPRRMMTGFVVLAAISVACACPGVPQISDLLGGEEAVEQLQQTAVLLLTDVPLEGLEETAMAVMTEVPAEDMMKTAEALATTMPVDEGLMETAEAEFGAIPGFGENEAPGGMVGELPPDIPVLPDNQNLMGTRDLVSYTTAIPFSDAVQFYKDQMPANGWEILEGQSLESENTTIMTYAKPDRQALVTITHDDGITNVTIAILPD